MQQADLTLDDQIKNQLVNPLHTQNGSKAVPDGQLQLPNQLNTPDYEHKMIYNVKTRQPLLTEMSTEADMNLTDNTMVKYEVDEYEASNHESDESNESNSLDKNKNIDESSIDSGLKNRIKKQSFTFSNCKICSDKATGVHYGISTCEGCKGFFKRNIQRNVYYQCFFGRNCILTPRTRNRCKACRFKRCLDAGMSFEGIKMGRIPKELKKKATLTKQDRSDNNSKSTIRQVPSSVSSFNEDQKKSENSPSSDNQSISDSNHSNSVVVQQSDQQQTNPLTSTTYDQGTISHLSNTLEPSQQPTTTRTTMDLSEYNTTMVTTKPSIKFISAQDLSEKSLEQFLNSIKFANNSTIPSTGETTQVNLNNKNRVDFQDMHQQSMLSISNIMSMNKLCSSSSMVINSNFLNMYMNRTTVDPSSQQICSVLNDKIYQLYNEHIKESDVIFEKLLECLRNMKEQGDDYIEDSDLKLFNGTSDTIWNGLIESLPEYVQSTFYFCKEMPGINELPHHEFSTVINNKLFELFHTVHSRFFFDDECYLILKNKAHYSKFWMTKVKGKKKTDSTFELSEMLNKVGMTGKERALLIPLMLTTTEKEEEDSILKNLNEYYIRAILYEFDLNKRDDAFILKMSKLISKLKECKQIELSND